MDDRHTRGSSGPPPSSDRARRSVGESASLGTGGTAARPARGLGKCCIGTRGLVRRGSWVGGGIKPGKAPRFPVAWEGGSLRVRLVVAVGASHTRLARSEALPSGCELGGLRGPSGRPCLSPRQGTRNSPPCRLVGGVEGEKDPRACGTAQSTSFPGGRRVGRGEGATNSLPR